MSARKKTTAGGVSVITPGAARSQRKFRLAYVLPITASLLLLTSYGVWQKVRGHVLSSSHYQIAPEQIVLTPPPAWVKSDVKAEVLRELNRAGTLSLLDEGLTLRLATAFATHPWVAKVHRVSKQFSSGVEVVVAYRVPAAMVEVENGTRVLPVDEQSVLLPTRDFTTDDVEGYPRIAEIRTPPAGPVGTRWGDPCVIGGAQIAVALAEDWKKLQLERIVPVERKPGKTGVEYTYALITNTGTMVFWGRPPSSDLPGEVPAREKIAQLKRYAAQNNGSLDGPDGPHEIEIDQSGALLRKARPAVTPLPKREAGE